MNSQDIKATMKRMTTALCALALLVACRDSSNSVTTMEPLAPGSGTTAYLVTSNSRPAIGSLVTVTVVASQAATIVKQVGAFSASLEYERAGLQFEGEAPLSGGLRAISDKDGKVLAAGASNEGFTRGQLFAVTFKVIDPSALASLRLDLTELTSTDFADRRPELTVNNHIHEARR